MFNVGTTAIHIGASLQASQQAVASQNFFKSRVCNGGAAADWEFGAEMQPTFSCR